MDPTGGLAEAFSGLAFLALKQIQGAAVAGALGFDEAAVVFEGAVDAPTLAEAVNRLLTVGMRKEVGHVESNAASPDEGNALAHLHFAASGPCRKAPQSAGRCRGCWARGAECRRTMPRL